MREFTFNKSYEEIKINEKPYTIDFSDDAIMKYQSKFNEFFKKQQELQAKLAESETEENVEEAKGVTKDIIETILGAGTFEPIYIESGKSLINMMDLVIFLSEILGDKMEKVRETNRKKYVKK